MNKRNTGLADDFSPDEKTLLLQISEGDESAFRKIFDRYRIQVYSFAFSLTHTDILAEEITQEVFIKVWEKRNQLAGMEYFSTWIKTIARNAAYSFFRRNNIEKKVLSEMSPNDEQPGSAQNYLEFREMEQKVRAAISELSPQQKTIYRLSREEMKSYSEIADALNISSHTVKYHLSNIFRQLRSKIGSYVFLISFLLKK